MVAATKGDAKPVSAHTCHAPGCIRIVPPRMFCCKPHWYKLPKRIRDAIWREYRPGQEIDKRPSLRYLAVQQLACVYLVFKPNSEKAAAEAMVYGARAIELGKKAVEAGLGDPLDGLITKDLKPGEVS